MRLWHVDLIPYLPDIHIVAQWRELCAIVKGIANTGKTNHVLINPIMDYPWVHTYLYSERLIHELKKRGYNISKSYSEFMDNLKKAEEYFPEGHDAEEVLPFPYWHNDRYLRQCYYNLEEKFDRGMITEKDWENIKTSTPIIMSDFNDYILPF